MRPLHDDRPAGEVARHFGMAVPPLLRLRYNVAPTQVVTVVRLNPSGERRAVEVHQPTATTVQ